MNVRITLGGRAYDRASTNSLELELAPGATVDDALRALAVDRQDGPPPSDALVVVGDTHIGVVREHGAVALRNGDEVFIFSPVGGG